MASENQLKIYPTMTDIDVYYWSLMENEKNLQNLIPQLKWLKMHPHFKQPAKLYAMVEIQCCTEIIDNL